MNLKPILLIIALLVINLASAANIGVSPATVSFNNVLRGGYAERNIIISSDSTSQMNISASVRGEITEWLNFSKSFLVEGNSVHSFKVELNPPVDIPNGNYTGFITIKAENPPIQVNGQNIAQIQPVIDVYVTVEITDIEINSCFADQFNVTSAEKGDDIIFATLVKNMGNVRITPSVTATVWDQDEVNIVTSQDFTSSEIIPTTEKYQTFRLSTKSLPIGQYWVDLSVPDCLSSSTLTFDVLEPGSLSDNGIITSIVSKVWANVGETLPIVVNFKNTGQKEETALFKGQITKEGNIVQTIETESLSVLPAEMTNFTFYLTPKEEGKYIVSGRVFYNKKRTFESSTIINVLKAGFSLSSIFLPVIYIILLVAAAVLIVKIRQERKLQKNRINEIRRLG